MHDLWYVWSSVPNTLVLSIDESRAHLQRLCLSSGARLACVYSLWFGIKILRNERVHLVVTRSSFHAIAIEIW